MTFLKRVKVFSSSNHNVCSARPRLCGYFYLKVRRPANFPIKQRKIAGLYLFGNPLYHKLCFSQFINDMLYMLPFPNHHDI